MRQSAGVRLRARRARGSEERRRRSASCSPRRTCPWATRCARPAPRPARSRSFVSLNPSGAGEYLIANELGVMLGDRVARARAPLSVGADGSLTCAAGVRQGSQVAILDGVPKNMVAAARAAAEEAKANLQGAKPAGVLLFDC